MDVFALSSGDWFVIRAHARQERILAEELLGDGLAIYQPRLCERRDYAGFRANVEVSMFPGYLFLRGTAAEAALVRENPRVASVAPVAPASGEDSRFTAELCAIELARSLGAGLRHSPIPEGSVPVKVNAGRFRGVVGVIDPEPIDVAESQCGKLYLPIHAIAQAVSMDVEPGALVPAR